MFKQVLSMRGRCAPQNGIPGAGATIGGVIMGSGAGLPIGATDGVIMYIGAGALTGGIVLGAGAGTRTCGSIVGFGAVAGVGGTMTGADAGAKVGGTVSGASAGVGTGAITAGARAGASGDGVIVGDGLGLPAGGNAPVAGAGDGATIAAAGSAVAGRTGPAQDTHDSVRCSKAMVLSSEDQSREGRQDSGHAAEVTIQGLLFPDSTESSSHQPAQCASQSFVRTGCPTCQIGSH